MLMCSIANQKLSMAYDWTVSGHLV